MPLPICLDASCGTTLQAQIVAAIRTLIEQHRLAPGAPVPASRDLGRQLGVSRNTVTAAYDELIAQGYLYTERAVGTFVARTLPDTLIRSPEGSDDMRSGSAHRALNLPLPYGGRGLTGLHRPVRQELEVDFVFGRTDPHSFPERLWRKRIVECLGGAAKRMSEYGHPAGLPELRQLIVNQLATSRGMVASAEQILMVAGFQQGIDLVAHLFVGTRTPVVIEAPTYRGAAFLFESYGAQVIPVAVDAHGVDVRQLPQRRVKLVYVTPSHQFPTGVTMPLHRRLALLEWAARNGAYILEVDYDADYRYDGAPLPTLQSLDRNGCVIYINSFTRTLGPGLRIGYMLLPRDLVRTAVTIKSLMDNGLPWLEQATLAQFIRDGSYDTHLRRLRTAHEARRDALVGALRTRLPEVRVQGADAGQHVLLRLPESCPPAVEVQAAARSFGTGVYPLSDSPVWFHEGLPGHERCLMLGYGHLAEEKIERGIEGLAQALSLSSH
ncbi:MocR-like pyridoxine biosynthesis transcription factor PdxR [Methyloversatilis thermotolerans]|uniref:MocR-like pyridoxine biosynthesis transcription factor PdxR n=1 Tax=Methyloversatilis thermotolerans TaxID=1346290 RepID=UPI0003A8AE20|nr:PLP-dependent aminotransferase family protein [Methyloversatilis thermotolerans]